MSIGQVINEARREVENFEKMQDLKDVSVRGLYVTGMIDGIYSALKQTGNDMPAASLELSRLSVKVKDHLTKVTKTAKVQSEGVGR